MPDRPLLDPAVRKDPPPSGGFIDQVVMMRAGCIASERCIPPVAEPMDAAANAQGCRLLIRHRLDEFNQLRARHPEWVPDFSPLHISAAFLLSAFMEGADVRDLLNPIT